MKFGMAAAILDSPLLLTTIQEWIKVGVTGLCDCVVKLPTPVCVLFRALTLPECFVKMLTTSRPHT